MNAPGYRENQRMVLAIPDIFGSSGGSQRSRRGRPRTTDSYTVHFMFFSLIAREGYDGLGFGGARSPTGPSFSEVLNFTETRSQISERLRPASRGWRCGSL